ncbi:hypothetical protein HLB23_31285 [Nocardia uniformis]|uniref:Uncharacterized protein n=1 Tax=Nocardia uniformis TaxID=53432 RepID=A0A849CJ81_9NOCA|nr:hypothetical protein [Nocardia uniformis]NNH74281.1 hypothetical protein [Nocardia uniformis]
MTCVRVRGAGCLPLHRDHSLRNPLLYIPAAGGVYASIRAGQQADADRRAQAERRTVSYQTRYSAKYDLYAEAVSQADVTRLLDQIEKNRPR